MAVPACRSKSGPCRQRLRWSALDDYAADVSQVFLEEMVAVVGIDRARACVAEFVADATARCLRLGELLPGWEAGSIVRNCEEISGLAETCGAVGLGDVLEEIADAVARNDRSHAEALVERLERVTARLGPAHGGVPGRYCPAVEGQREQGGLAITPSVSAAGAAS